MSKHLVAVGCRLDGSGLRGAEGTALMSEWVIGAAIATSVVALRWTSHG
ncbi:MAG: hypothetical protein WBZ37_01240 [Mycobacterium sp.]